jgi:uncharacterized protein YukE
MGNPALEEFFGRPETIERLSDALRQAQTGLDELKGALDAEVSGLVPGSWNGQAASSFSQHWQQQSAMTAQVAQQTGWMSTAMRVLATELRAALSLFQAAEEAADANACYITPFYVVLPYSWWDLEAVAAMEFIQGMVAASMGMAEAARAQAYAELGVIWAEPGALGFLKDLGSGFVAGLEDLWQTVEMAAKLSPQRAMVDPLGWWHDEVKYAKGMWQAVTHPGAVLKKLVDWEDWTNGHPGRAIGKLAPMAIITALTAGGGAAADGAVASGEVAAEAGSEAAAMSVTEEVGAATVTGTEEAATETGAAAAETGAQVDRLGVAVDRSVDVESITPQPVWRETAEPLFRFENRPTETIFNDGFAPRNPANTDLLDYVQNNTPSAFVSTTQNDVLAWGSKFRYEIQAPGGIDVNQSLGKVIFPGEQEIAFPGGIQPQYIKGANPLGPNGELGEWIPNPGFKPNP